MFIHEGVDLIKPCTVVHSQLASGFPFVLKIRTEQSVAVLGRVVVDIKGWPGNCLLYTSRCV